MNTLKTSTPDGSSSSDTAHPVRLREFVAGMPARIAACWRFKTFLTLSLAVLFCTPYLLIGHYPLLPVHSMELSWIDRWIGFHPKYWVWVYQSIYIPINVIPWLSDRREDLRRYVSGFAILATISFTIFFLYPIRAPKPEVSQPTGMYWILQEYDATFNSLPSLHAGL